MKQNNKTFIYCITAVCAILALCGAVCLLFAIKDEYQSAMGYFSVTSVFAPVSYVLLLCAPAVGIVAWIRHVKCASPDTMLPSSLFLKITACAVAAAILLSVVMGLVGGGVPATYNNNKALIIIEYVSYALAIISAVSICMTTFATGRRLKATASLFAFFPPLYFSSRILYEYFDQTVAVNSPIKIITQLSLVCFVLFMTAETGLSLGRGNLFPRYLFTLCISVVIPGAFGLAGLLLRLFSDMTFSVRVSDSAVFFFTALYAGARLFSVSRMELLPRAERVKVKKENNIEIESEEETEIVIDDDGDGEV